MAASPAQARLRLVSASVATTPTTDQPAVRELDIEIYPRGYDWWHGTSAQLQAEGLIPADFEWPKRLAHKSWTDDRFEYWLYRERPTGHKGPQSSYWEADNWACRRLLLAHGRDGFAHARLHEISVSLQHELWAHTSAAREQFKRYWAAHEDQSFQAFKAIFVPQPKKRGRPSKAKATAQGAQS
jgi:hypothetical protein